MNNLPAFLRNSKSQLAADIAAFNWGATSLGPIEQWPISLRNTLATMLACPTPMYVAWGPDLISFYNDAYRPLLGYREATALGKPFPELWSSLWSDIEPLVDEALAGGHTRVVNMRLDLSREGVPEESYWTFSYSPVFDDDGQPCGMLCVTDETTAGVVALRDRDAADERLQLALSAGNSIGAWDWDVENDIVRADSRFAALYGVDASRAAAGAPIAEFFSGIHPDDRPRVLAEVDTAIKSSDIFRSEYRLQRSDGTVRWVAAQGRCVRDSEGRCIRFPGVSFDITERIQTELEIRNAKEERDFVIALTNRQRAVTDPLSIIRLSMEALGQRLGVHRAGFYRLLNSQRLQHVGCWSNGSMLPLVGDQPLDAYGQFAEGERRSGRTLVFSDSRHDSDGKLAPYGEDGVLAGICVPLMEGGRWSAGIYLHHASVRHWTQAEISLAREVAGLIAVSVDRAEALMRLNQQLDQQAAQLSNVASQVEALARQQADAETQIRQLQKMEAIGQLTGGIAHDFNNMLAIIIGGLNFAQRRLARGETNISRYIDNALEGATRAANLTQRLLAFSRQQPLVPEAIDVNRLVMNLSELLARTLGENIQLETALGVGLWNIKADPGQLENTIVNAAVNGRDAMPDGGKLTLETSNASVDDEYAREQSISVGQYVLISITDTGMGMNDDVLAKAFDPFFTTKEVGKGTGLGLSQVFGFVRQSGGHVKIYSEVGYGTTVKLYLPRFWGVAPQPIPRRVVGGLRTGNLDEIILVVEDEDRVRNLTVEALREFGYTVLLASSGREALEILDSDQPVTLLLTDVVMPEMNGKQLADLVLAKRPSLHVLFVTGYSRNAVLNNGVLDPGTNFLAKPYGLDQLAEKVREVLDTPKLPL